MDDNILLLDEFARKEQVKTQLKQIGRPSLLRRIGSGLLDLLFIFAALVILEFFAAGVVFRPLGYFDAQNDVNTVFAESGLYLRINGFNVQLPNAYDESKSVEDNYDKPLTAYYTNDARCREQNKLADYVQAKRDSGFYTETEDGLVLREDADEGKLKSFFEQQYAQAVDFLTTDPVYVAAVNKTFNVMIYSLLICFLIAAAVFYFIVPLARKDGETVGQIICKICLVDASCVGRVRKMQVVVRSLVVVVLNFLIPFWIFVFFNHVTMLPTLVTFAMMCLVKYNRSVQDFASQTQVILKRDAAPLKILNKR